MYWTFLFYSSFLFPTLSSNTPLPVPKMVPFFCHISDLRYKGLIILPRDFLQRQSLNMNLWIQYYDLKMNYFQELNQLCKETLH